MLDHILNSLGAGALTAFTVGALDPPMQWWLPGVCVAVVLLLVPPCSGTGGGS